MAPVRHAVPVAVTALAAASLLLPFALLYDPWAWLVWGREVTGLDLDTAAGPSWKPLPVLLTTAFAPSGDAAPELWLCVARLGWLAAIALAWRLAARLVFPGRFATRLAERLAPSRVRRARALAGAVAALGVALLFDPFTSWARQFAGGLSEPLLVALVLGAVDRELSGRRGQALALGLGAALLRPEAWPFLALYGVHVWRRDPGLRRWLIAVAVAVPALWLVPDLIGSGDPLTGATRAREATGFPPWEALEAIGRSLNLVLVALWVAAAFAVHGASRAGERAIGVLAAGALGWIAVVAVLSAGGYAGLPRFAAPAGAIACVLGGIGIVRMLAALDGIRDHGRRRAAVAGLAVLIAALVIQGAVRAAEIPGELDGAAAYAEGIDDLTALADRLGPDEVAACGPVATTEFLSSTALAWRLERPLDAIGLRASTAPPAGTAFADSGAAAAVREAIAAAGRRLGAQGAWSAYAISCAGERAIAGVGGASR